MQGDPRVMAPLPGVLACALSLSTSSLLTSRPDIFFRNSLLPSPSQLLPSSYSLWSLCPSPTPASWLHTPPPHRAPTSLLAPCVPQPQGCVLQAWSLASTR